MNIITSPIKNVRSSDNDLVTTVLNEADTAYRVQKNNFDRAFRSWKQYFASEGDQWDDESLITLKEEYRNAAQFNVTTPKVNALAGAILADLPDMSWAPVDGQKSIVTESVAETYYTDRDLYNYEDVFLKVFRDGFVHSGDLYICEDSKYGMPRIKFAREMPGFLIWDPYWKTDDDRDVEIVYRVRYLLAPQLVRHYNTKAEEILREMREYKRDKSNYPTRGDDKRRQFDSRVGDEFKIIEKHYLEHIKAVRLMGRREGSLQWIPFPIRKERAYLERFADLNQIDWTTVIETTYEDRIHYYTAVCDSFKNLALVSGAKSPIQVNGLPFFHFTSNRFAGKDMGIVEQIRDVQQTINKRESLVTEIISKANGGSTLVEKDMFQDEKQRQDFQKKKNKPGHVEFVNLQGVKVPFMHYAQNQYPSAVLDQIGRMYNTALPLASMASDALSSITDSGDSGILYERKYQINMIANTLLNRSIRQFIQNVGEAYFYQWQLTYSDQERNILFRDGKTRITLNKREGGLVYNNPMSVPRMRVVTTENTKSQTYQMRWRSIWAEMLNSIDYNAAPAHYLLAMKNFFETIEMKEEDKEQLKVINEMMMMKARLILVKDMTGVQSGIQGDTLVSMQTEAQIEQMMQQLQGMAQPQQQQGVPQQQAEAPIEYPEEGGFNPDLNKMNPQQPEAAAIPRMTPPAMAGMQG